MDAYEPSPQNGPGGLTGTVLSDRYRLEEQIGSGGMGTVWKATDTLLSRPVAVKLLHPSQMAEPTARERFRTEGRITAGLSHPGIAQVYDYGEEEGRAFLIMELVVGEPLSQVLRENGHLTPDQTLDFVCQAAQALAAAHARGVVHRDIKPGNLLVTADGQLKLTDFGIARGDMSVTLTQTGMVMGTAQYISPEQASGRPATSSSDLYALGVVAYECLAGTPPFTGDTPVALALAHTREDPPELPDDIPADVEHLVSSLLLKDPEERPSSASEVAHLAAVIRSNSGTGPPTPAAGFEGMAQTAVVGAVPEPVSGAVPRRSGGQATVPPDLGGDSATLSGGRERRISASVVMAVITATVLIAAAVLAGFVFGDRSPASNVREAVDPPPATSSPSSDDTDNPEDDTTSEEAPVVPDEETGWSTDPREPVESPAPGEGEDEASPSPENGDEDGDEDGGGDQDGDPGRESPPPEDPGNENPGDPPPPTGGGNGGDDGGSGGGGDTPPGNGGGSGESGTTS
ncbi:serine/threonine protein kinase [Nocardiopsis sp. TSRI0078]|uniref:serine/threonine-protein kinase n=1 Tax=unclassified Nocardiopsis TaxID=2649073 RepID=UPI00093AD8BC|nr:serine/threonine-protein kinase [Nocardiopsis sp. TSRI0078]OKI20773.1 serine/threonine protein kinase [Nocardiopsis sp. TSRI0078]